MAVAEIVGNIRGHYATISQLQEMVRPDGLLYRSHLLVCTHDDLVQYHFRREIRLNNYSGLISVIGKEQKLTATIIHFPRRDAALLVH